jgi:hypothetical protein
MIRIPPDSFTLSGFTKTVLVFIASCIVRPFDRLTADMATGVIASVEVLVLVTVRNWVVVTGAISVTLLTEVCVIVENCVVRLWGKNR